MSSDRFRNLLRLLMRSFNVPPSQIPREEMWQRIRLARDFNRLEQPVPSETMWEKLLRRRRPAPHRVRLHPSMRGVPDSASRGSARHKPRGRVTWLIAPALAFAASAVFAVLRAPSEPRSAANPGIQVVETAPVQLLNAPSASLYQFAGDGDAGYLPTPARRLITYYAATTPQPWNPSATDDPVNEAYKRAAVAHLRRSDALISGFRALGHAHAADRKLRATARELLTTTRLLMDSPVAARAHYQGVLADLELVLVRISLISPNTARAESEQIEKTLERKKLLVRLRGLIPGAVNSNAD